LSLPVLSALPAQEQRAKELLARHTDKDWTDDKDEDLRTRLRATAGDPVSPER